MSSTLPSQHRVLSQPITQWLGQLLSFLSFKTHFPVHTNEPWWETRVLTHSLFFSHKNPNLQTWLVGVLLGCQWEDFPFNLISLSEQKSCAFKVCLGYWCFYNTETLWNVAKFSSSQRDCLFHILKGCMSNIQKTLVFNDTGDQEVSQYPAGHICAHTPWAGTSEHHEHWWSK